MLLITFCLSGCQSHRALRHPIGSKSGDQQYYPHYLDLNLTNAEADANLFICCGNSGDLGRDRSGQALGCCCCEEELGADLLTEDEAECAEPNGDGRAYRAISRATSAQ